MQKLLREYQRERSHFEEQGHFPKHAAVLITITDHPTEPHIVLTKRATHLSQHAGEVSFPGGKWEPGDQSLIETALRETHEEIGVSPHAVEVLNVEPSTTSRGGLRVTPYVGLIPHDTDFDPCPEEIEAVFRVPVQYFLRDPRYRTDVYDLSDNDSWAPAYQFEGHDIWGLTARILVRFLNNALNADIKKKSDAPIRVRSRLPVNKFIQR